MPYHPIDVHVGQRLRLRRTLLGMSQTALGNAVGLTFQQVQKYERGSNRTGASRLYEFATILRVPVSFFFEEMAIGQPKKKARKGKKPIGGDLEGIATNRETLQLVRAYYKIRNATVRDEIRDMIRRVAVKL